MSIYVVDQGWHTGLVVASKDIDEDVRALLWGSSSPPAWTEIGWGDEDFYIASGYSYWLGFKAALFSSGSVIHVAGFSSKPEHFFRSSKLFKLSLQSQNLSVLNAKVRTTIQVDENDSAVQLGKSLYGTGHFYKATGKFSIFNTCNSWTAEILSEIGCPVEPNVTRASTISDQLLEAAEAQQAPPR